MSKSKIENKIAEAIDIIKQLGLPKNQQNDRTALCLLALLDLSPEKEWIEASDPLIGITPIMDWIKLHYQKEYAPNSRETIRRFSIHQMIEGGFVLYNPDELDRPTNSPNTVYKIESIVLKVLRSYKTDQWDQNLSEYFSINKKIIDRNKRISQNRLIEINIPEVDTIELSPGKHNELIKDIIYKFKEIFIPGSKLLYIGDTKEKWGYFDQDFFINHGIQIDSHGKMPDVIFFYPKKEWLIILESVTSHGPVDWKRHSELRNLFTNDSYGLVFVTAFPDKSIMSKYISEIDWETEVWVADSPGHLIHFNGERFLGPY
jgi:hypothetical protein